METVSKEQFVIQELQRVAKLFGIKYRVGFPTKEAFTTWYVNQLQKQDFNCYYCDTSIFDIRKLINRNKLLTRKTGYGVRGPILEIDKMINAEGYLPANCVLSCYYCNNDKSYTLNSVDYKKFFGPTRKAFFEHLLNEIVSKNQTYEQ